MMDEKLSIMRLAHPLAALLVAATLLAASSVAQAEFRLEAGAAPLVVAQLPPDQRRLMRQEMREHWQQMPPDERQRLRDGRRERWQQMPQQMPQQQDRQRWQQMPPEDRQRLREEMRGRRDESGGGYGTGPRGPAGGYRGGRP
jgi:Protein of unknown function (DUF3106)